MITQISWTLFLKTKNEAFDDFHKLAKVIQNEKGLNIVSIRSDHGGEFQNDFYEKNEIHHNFSAPRTSQETGVVERKNRSIE